MGRRYRDIGDLVWIMRRPAGDRLRFLELAVSAAAGQPDFQEPESITNPLPGQDERQACELLLRAG